MNDRGQATVEALGMLPAILFVILAAVQGLAYGSARESARAAAHAGALAIAQEREPVAAARATLRGISRDRTKISVRGREVSVRVRPAGLLPSAARIAVAEATASAGPR